MGTTPTTGPASGRPRDPGLEARVLDAAFSVYARRGWAGFTSEEVARQAGVGKSSLYLRWPTKLAVLLDSIRLRERDNVVADTGDLRHDLLAFARQTFDRLNGEDGAVTLRLIVESRFYDDLRDGLSSAAHIEQIHAIRAIVRRAIKRGDLGFQRAGCLHVARTEAKMLCAVLRGSEAATPEAVNCGYLARTEPSGPHPDRLNSPNDDPLTHRCVSSNFIEPAVSHHRPCAKSGRTSQRSNAPDEEL